MALQASRRSRASGEVGTFRLAGLGAAPAHDRRKVEAGRDLEARQRDLRRRLAERCVLSSPPTCLSEYSAKARDDYCADPLTVSEAGAREDWLVCFLRGVRLQADKT